MAKDRNGSLPERDLETESPSKRDRSHRSKRRKDESSASDGDKVRSKRRRSNRRHRKRESEEDSSFFSDSSSESSETEPDGSDSLEESESDGEMRRRRRKERKRRKERDYEKDRQRRKEREKRRRKEREGKDEKRGKKKKKDKEKKMKKREKEKKGAVTNSWGKYGVIRETDMWNKRPEFTAWLSEVKQVNLESLPNWEEKQMFKDFMEDHNTATFPSKKYYDLDAYHQHKMAKEMKKGLKKVLDTERTVFNDEEQRRQELLRERERHKEEQVETLKRSMQSGMAQAMKEQAQLREEMAYQYRLGNFEAAAAIQRRLDPDVAL